MLNLSKISNLFKNKNKGLKKKILNKQGLILITQACLHYLKKKKHQLIKHLNIVTSN